MSIEVGSGAGRMRPFGFVRRSRLRLWLSRWTRFGRVTEQPVNVPAATRLLRAEASQQHSGEGAALLEQFPQRLL